MIKKSAMLVASLGLLGLGATAAFAGPADAKQWEVTLAGSGQNSSDFDGTTFGVNGTLGYYFNPQMEINVRQDVTYTDLTGGDKGSSWDGSTRVGFDYHFDFGQDQRIIPFIGAEIGYIYGDLTNDTFTAGPEAGVKWYVNDTTFIYGSALYEFFFDKASQADNNFNDGRFVYNLGVGFRF